ncbi:MAG: hypothetical protein JSS72_05275 [Armatimonadetes bacterium]|nr:hypothetical protein [Armatimonadota bacterium]
MQTTAYRNRLQVAGQTLFIALIILGVLLLLSLSFLGIVSRGLRSGNLTVRRTLAGDLAEAGIRYAHSQLLNSQEGADWRGTPTAPLPNDPDAKYLRASLGFPDKGGPDGLGPYRRVRFDNGRALIRVRYAPSDATVFQTSAPGTIRQPNLLRNYLIIESVGRTGVVNPSDPTTLRTPFSGEETKRIAFASIGIIESARYISNKYNVSRPAEIGFPFNLGTTYTPHTTPGGVDTWTTEPVNTPINLGGRVKLINPYDPKTSSPTETSSTFPSMGSMYVNADLKIYGNVVAAITPYVGDGIRVNGTIEGVNEDGVISDPTKHASLTLNTSFFGLCPDGSGTAGQWNECTAVLKKESGNPDGVLDSQDPGFSTYLGVLRDSQEKTDTKGFTRAVPYKAPPSIERIDPDSGENRYVLMTALSGKQLGGTNNGKYGHGRGVYVDNADDRQVPSDEAGRVQVGASQSLVYDWLNPNNGGAYSGWQGPYYVPRGAYLTFLPDGFIITRDQRGSNRTWKKPDGTDSGQAQLRFKLGKIGNQVYIVNSLTPGVDINNTTRSSVNFTNGLPFNGVLYFAGDVRVRGQYPTNTQITVVSGGSIYVEGSLTKGLVQNMITDENPDPSKLITTPPTALMALLAKDYVVLNTTQFFGTAQGTTPAEAKEVLSTPAYNPLRIPAAAGQIGLRTEFLLDPTTGTPGDPATYQPYVKSYNAGGTSSDVVPTDLLLMLTHTMDDGPASNSFINLNVNAGLATPQYLFERKVTAPGSNYYYPGPGQPNANINYRFSNSAALYAPYRDVDSPAAQIPFLGLGAQAWERAPKFETEVYPLLSGDPTATFTFPNLTDALTRGTYTALAESMNVLEIVASSIGSIATNDYLLARAAIVPHDIRIEAVMYAEEGSFFVIPGPWFNPNPNDRHDNYQALGGSQADRVLARRDNYGTSPFTPFYGEPIDERIQIIGAISENMPPPIGQQAEWLKKWGWIPGQLGESGYNIPTSHRPAGWDFATKLYVPNLSVTFDPVLATGRPGGFLDNLTNLPIRTDAAGNVLPPLPRLPVCPVLSYFGEANAQ